MTKAKTSPLNLKLRALRERAGLSMEAMADALSLERKSSYQYYENGFRKPSLPEGFLDPLRTLLVGRGSPPIADAEVSSMFFGPDAAARSLGDEFVPVPVYDIQASAGHGSLVEDGEPLHYQMFRHQVLRRLTRSPVDQLAVIHVDGDSMAGTLLNGDQVLVDRSVQRVVKSGIYVVLFEGELLVKRCERDMKTGALLIKSDNPIYQGQRIEADDPVIFQIIGRVIWMARALA